MANVGEASDHWHADGSRDDRHVRRQGAFFQEYALEAATVVLKKIGRPEVSGDQNESLGNPVCAAVPIRPETMRNSRPERSSRSCIRSCSSGSSISSIRARVRC